MFFFCINGSAVLSVILWSVVETIMQFSPDSINKSQHRKNVIEK